MQGIRSLYIYMICTRCGINKPTSEFFKDKDKKCGFRRQCKVCLREVRGRNITPAHLRKRQNINQLPTDGITLKDKLAFVISSKEGQSCSHCGCKPHTSALDYHHIDDSQKKFGLSNIRKFKTNEITLEAIKLEMLKCVLLCSNCHRTLHAGALTLN